MNASSRRAVDDLPNTELLGKRPVVLLGCDTRELTSIIGFAWMAGMLAAFIMAIFVGFVFFILFALLMWIAFAGLGIVYLREEKRQKPYGYYIQKFLRVMAGFARNHSVYVPEQSGWDTRRHRNTNRS